MSKLSVKEHFLHMDLLPENLEKIMSQAGRRRSEVARVFESKYSPYNGMDYLCNEILENREILTNYPVEKLEDIVDYATIQIRFYEAESETSLQTTPQDKLYFWQKVKEKVENELHSKARKIG